MIKIENVKQGLKNYYHEELLPMSWKMSFIEPILNKAIDNAERQYKSIIDMIKNDDGSIDIDYLHQEYRKKVQAIGSVEILGIKFNSDDIDKLVEHIKRTEVTQ